jgi:hypothetical protein
MNFGDALTHLKNGQRVTRAGWNGRGMWLVLVPGSTFTVQEGRPLGQAAPELVGRTVEYRPHIDMKTVDGQIVPWIASQSDMLADDWMTVSNLDSPDVTHTVNDEPDVDHAESQPGGLLHDVDPRLLSALADLGRTYGPLGVAIVAAGLTDPALVIQHFQAAAPTTIEPTS